MSKNFCPHIFKAKEALRQERYAEVEAVDIKAVLKKVTDENLEESLLRESSDGEVTAYLLPGCNIAVPMLDMFATENSENFVHVRDFQCSLPACSKKVKSKKHTLVEKGVPVCAHSILGIKTVALFLYLGGMLLNHLKLNAVWSLHCKTEYSLKWKLSWSL